MRLRYNRLSVTTMIDVHPAFNDTIEKILSDFVALNEPLVQKALGSKVCWLGFSRLRDGRAFMLVGKVRATRYDGADHNEVQLGSDLYKRAWLYIDTRLAALPYTRGQFGEINVRDTVHTIPVPQSEE